MGPLLTDILKSGHLANATTVDTIFGPNGARFREVPLYTRFLNSDLINREFLWLLLLETTDGMRVHFIQLLQKKCNVIAILL